jgi:dipeptidyl aminopeptidase/acylaminoacyl peptidase
MKLEWKCFLCSTKKARSKMLEVESLLRIPRVDVDLRFDISPDGTLIAYAWNGSGTWDIYEQSLTGKGPSKRITTGIGAKFSPRYSPDGKSVAFSLDPDGSESYHICRYDRRSNSQEDLTPGIGYAHQPNCSWSPDGKTVAVLSNEAGHFALSLLSIKSRDKKLLLDLHRPTWDVIWSPDGKWIAVEAEWTASNRSIFILDPVSGKSNQLSKTGGFLNASQPAWSPDSKQFAFSGQRGDWLKIGIFGIESRNVSWIESDPGDDIQPAWSNDGDGLAWIHSCGVDSSIRVQNGGREIRNFELGKGCHHHPRFAARGLVVIYEAPDHPPDLYHLNVETGIGTPLTNSLPSDLDPSSFTLPRQVSYKGKDGTQIPAILFQPVNASNCSPAVIHIHGGPNWHHNFSWNPLLSHMASRGWTVLGPNYRGSTGYGMKWQNASRFDMGGVDTNDCASGVDFLVDHNLADKQRIAVTGESHGGFLTISCMTTYPDLWVGGSAFVPFLNWFKSHYESREDLQHWNLENMGNPQENRERWFSRSPAFFLERINAPVQLICGENDPRCPASDTIEAYDKLRRLGKSVDLHAFKNQGHGFLDQAVRVAAEQRRVDFLANLFESSHH